MDAAHFGRNVRNTVRFADALQALASDGVDVVVELAPHPVLGAAVAECLTDDHPDVRIVASLRRDRPARAPCSRTGGRRARCSGRRSTARTAT